MQTLRRVLTRRFVVSSSPTSIFVALMVRGHHSKLLHFRVGDRVVIREIVRTKQHTMERKKESF